MILQKLIVNDGICRAKSTVRLNIYRNRKESFSMENKSQKETEKVLLQEKKREMQLDEAFELGNCASASDCTGSVPAAPLTKNQWKNYDKTYHFQPKTVKKEQQ